MFKVSAKRIYFKFMKTEYDFVKIKKDREWFGINHNGKDISVTIDSVRFDHSQSMRYFIECDF